MLNFQVNHHTIAIFKLVRKYLFFIALYHFDGLVVVFDYSCSPLDLKVGTHEATNRSDMSRAEVGATSRLV